MGSCAARRRETAIRGKNGRQACKWTGPPKSTENGDRGAALRLKLILKACSPVCDANSPVLLAPSTMVGATISCNLARRRGRARSREIEVPAGRAHWRLRA
eukprot:2217298-Prymnesium_polylepis.1